MAADESVRTAGLYKRRRAARDRLFLVAVAVFTLLSCTPNNEYEVVERSQKEVPNFHAAGTHTELDYVLLHDGHKIYASCDTTTVDNLDQSATCGFRPLRKYSCRAGEQQGDKALSDLLCQDAEGHNVYLYVSKKE